MTRMCLSWLALNRALEPTRRPLLLHTISMSAAERRAIGRDEADGPVICIPCLRELGDRPHLLRGLADLLDDPRPDVVASAELALAMGQRSSVTMYLPGTW